MLEAQLDRTEMTILSEDDLSRFGRAVWPTASARTATAVNQAKFGLSRVLPILQKLQGKDVRLLEVGAGCMLLSAYLTSKGFEVTALEPLTPDFSSFGSLQAEVLSYCARHHIAFERANAMAEDHLAPGHYDFIFMIHVLEHTHEPLRVLENLYSDLKAPGYLLVVCPNYDVLFEPHLGILLAGRQKALNECLYSRRIAAKQDIWEGLTFVRYSQLRRFLSAHQMCHCFNRQILRDMFLRLGEDKLLYGRMPGPVRWTYHGLRRLGLLRLLPLIPVRLQTPMELLVSK
jgi:SAM-dependent methyltransferase